MERKKIPVVIIGGGGCGLAASIMLSNLGIEHVLVEAHATTSSHPKASLINSRTAEILDQHGVWNDVIRVSCPQHNMKYFYYMTSLGGHGRDDRVELGRLPAYGSCDEPDHELDYLHARRLSAYPHTNLPLIRLEPILRSAAERRNPGNILFGHKMVSLQETADCVLVEVVDQETNSRIVYETEYVVGADGGKSVASMLGIKYEGFENLADTTSVLFQADLKDYWPEGALLTYLLRLQGIPGELGIGSPFFGGNWSVIVQSGPSWGKDCEEWQLHIGLGQHQVPLETLSEDQLKQAIRDTLDIPDLAVKKILARSRWHIDGVCASQFQTKRVFLAGDAAHRHPPITGLGLNTGIGDAHNLTWKLAAVLKGHANPVLLQTYEHEREPTARRIVDWAMFAFGNLRTLDSATGLLPGGKAILSHNEVVYSKLMANTYDGRVRRAALAHAIQSQTVETAARDIELNSIYQKGALVPDGSEERVPDPRGHLIFPTARPGHRLPHAWLLGSRRVSNLQLLDAKGSWLLLTDCSGASAKWNEHAIHLTEATGLSINLIRIGAEGDYEDESGQWQKDAGVEVGHGGVVLVRPDHYVAFRATTYSPEAELEFRKVREMLSP